MITVAELQSQRLSGIDKIIETLETKIIAAEDSGNQEITFAVHSFSRDIIKELIRQLEGAGYRVKRNSGSVFNDSFDNLHIRWE
jgi:hypothetical protein